MKPIAWFSGVTTLWLLVGARAWADPAARPLFTLEAQGPTAQVTAVAFSPDGRTLYAAGYDKVVRVWKLRDGKFVLDARHPGYRVPVGPGTAGAINAIAVSPDGAWLAVSGLGVVRGGAGFDKPGFDVDVAGFTDDMWRDRGVIEVFSLRDADKPVVKHLRGHRGEVLALAFAPIEKGQPLRLISAGRELQDRAHLRFTGQVRLWDVDRQTTLATEDSRQPVHLRPGLACWGAGSRLRVAITWGNGRIRIWNPAAPAGTPAHEVADGVSGLDNPLVCWRSGSQDRLLSCSWQQGGWLRGWAAPPGNQPQQQVRLPTPEGVRSILPMALTVVSSGADGTPDHAAVVARLKTAEGRYVHRLYLVRLADFQVVAQESLWGWSGSGLPWSPIVAAVPHGPYLAVAGNSSHEIWVYSIRDLLAHRGTAAHLTGVGAVMRSLTFVRRGQGPGVALFLSPAPKHGPGSPVDLTEGGDRLVFDFLKTALIPYDPGHGWLAVSPGDADWKVSLLSKEAPPNAAPRWRFAWSGPGSQSGTFTIGPYPREELTDYALVPPGKLPEPVLVVASWRPDKGEPRLNLYNSRSQRFRALVGHRDRIAALAVTPDGKLLASTAQDQTVCLWGLTDLDTISGRHAMAAGVDLDPARTDKSLVVIKAVPDLQSPKGLRVGDRVKARSFPGTKAERPFATPADFYAAVWDSKPDHPLPLRIERGGRDQSADLAVTQGVDDRKPLLTLFITDNPKAREWIAWTPVGPYDRSSAGAERFLGWQFNPAEPGEPTRFAAAEDYRGQFYTPRLLPAIARTADLGRALDEIRRRPVPKTGLGAALYENGIGPQPADARGQILVRQRKLALDLTVNGAALRQHEVASLTLQVGTDKPRPLDLTGARGQTVLTRVQLPEQRGVYPIHLVLRTREDNPQVVQRTLTLRYQPPPPEVNFDTAWLRRLAADGYVVTKRKLTIQAHASQAPGEPIKLILTHNGKDVPVSPGPDIQVPLELQPGDNLIKLRAENQNALRDFTDSETSPERSLVVHYREEGKLSLVVQEVVTATGRIAVKPDTPILVDTPQVQVVGRIQGAAPLVEASWSQKSTGRQGIVQGFKAGTAAGLAFHEQFRLEPGKQDIQFTARTQGKRATRTLTLTYQPALPALTLVQPPERIEGRDSAALNLVGLLTAADDGRPFRVIVRANDAETSPPVDARNLPRGKPTPVSLGTIRLHRGANPIEVCLTNDWGANLSRTIAAIYHVPPRIVSLTSPQLAGRPSGKPWDGKPSLDLLAEVESPDKPQAILSGADLPADKLTVEQVPAKEGRPRWRVRAQEVPLKEGANVLTLAARNADGPCLEPRTLEVAYSPPRPPPTVIFPELADNIQVQDPAYTVRFRVRSQVRLRDVELVLTNAAGRRVTPVANVANRQTPEPDGVFLLTAEQGVQLEPGANQVAVRAVTEQGIRQEAMRVLSYVPQPARLIVDQPPPQTDDARLTLRGRVVWNLPAEESLVDQRIRRLGVYVNGFRQQPAQVAPAVPGRKERHFTVPLVLNREGDNRIEVDCPGLPLARGGRQSFTVSCARPERPSTLHLLVVGIGKEQRDMESRALTALQVPADALALRNAIFSKIIMHPYSPHKGVQVLAGYVRRGTVRGVLGEMRRFIEEHGSATDVALVYWLGTEAVNEDGKLCLPTSESLPGERLTDTAVSMEELLEGCQDMPGAQVLLFDLAGRRPLTLDLASTRAAVLRESWSRKEPYPGLLDALKRASDTGQPASLQEVVRAAEILRARYPDSLGLDHNLKAFPFLASLVVSRKPNPAP